MKLRAAVIFIADLGDGIPRAGGLDARPAAGVAGVVVPLAGLEPARCFHHLILSQARLPIPPQGHKSRKYSGGRGPVNGFGC
jgi:hypothetical protein